MMNKSILKGIKWLGHDGFSVEAGGVVVVVDPYQLQHEVRADILLITHPHYDHCSLEDVQQVLKSSTVIITEEESAGQLQENGITNDMYVLVPGESTTVSGVTVEAFPAYNTNKKFHPKQNGWLGFRFVIDGTSIYHAGDTDIIPEMKTIDVDIALLPVSGTYVMDAGEAVEAAKIIGPEIAIPMHYDSIVGTTEDADTFSKGLAGSIEVFLPEKM